jgi:OPA family glycerol-3-phosphate transporter-like MFS transporter/OPA family sugar phosphate sensor protein UhpC-like MFS transporter
VSESVEAAEKNSVEEQSVFEGFTVDQRKKFNRWQVRTILLSILGYAMFYFVRKNLSVSMPYISQDLGFTKTDFGMILTLHGLVYGLSKFINGMWGDRSNARVFLVVGLTMTAVCNICFGFSSSLLFLGIFWVLNGWFQGMGVPPCTRLMTHWVPPYQLATKMSIWNTSHSIGAGLALVFCGYIVSADWSATTGISQWRLCFFLPACVVLVVALVVWLLIRDTPKSVGLPEMNLSTTKAEAAASSAVSQEEKAAEKAEHHAFVMKHVFLNKNIWIIALGNFFLYTVRFTILDWGPTMLKEHFNMNISSAAWLVTAFEIFGLMGMLVAGYVTDHVFKGRAPRTCVICMSMVAVCAFVLWRLTPDSPKILIVIVLALAGFFVYGPQALVGIAAANYGTSRAAATAGGFCGLFGYGSTIVSGIVVGKVVESSGWGTALSLLIGLALVSAIIFSLAWKAKATGYEE